MAMPGPSLCTNSGDSIHTEYSLGRRKEWGKAMYNVAYAVRWPRPLRKDISLVNVLHNIEIYSNGGALVLAG